MSIASRIESMYDHVGEVYDTITNVELPEDKNIENIPNTIKDSYLKIMNEGYQEIWDNWDKREATITDGTINGTEEAPMSLVYKGNTYQYTADIAGKNLFNFNSTARTHFGTLTINDDTLTLAGGGDASQVWWGIDVSSYTGNITISYSELTGATMHESDNKLSYCFMSSIPTNWNNMGTLTDVDKTNKYATTALGGGNYLIIVLQAGAGNAFVDGWASVSEVQVELGSTPTSYERFAGATPTPSLPSPVQVVSGDNTINVTGKNLFSGDYSQFTNTGGTGTTYDYFKLPDDNKQYTLTVIAKNDFTVTGSTFLGFTTNGGNGGTSVDWVISQGSGTIAKGTILSKTSTSNRRYVSLYSTGATSLKNFTDNFYIQLEEGSTATTYEEYKGSSYPISLGVENLFPSSLAQRDTTSVYTSSIPVMPNTTYSIDTSLSNLKIYNIYQDADKNTIDNSDWMNIPTTFTTINGCYYLQIVIGKSDSSAITTSEVEGKIDLTKGTTPQRITNTPIQLLHIPNTNYYDKIDKSSGKNLWDEQTELGLISTTTGQNTPSTTQIRSVNYIPVKPNTTYFITLGSNSSNWCAVETYKIDKTFLSNLGSVVNNHTFTTPDNCYYIRFYLSASYGTTYNHDIMLNEGTTALPYEPYGTNWYLKKEIGKVVLDGSESWNYVAPTVSTDYSYLFTTSYDNVLLPNVFTGLCNNFVNYGTYLAPSRNVSNECFSNGDTSVCLRFFVDKTRASNTTQWSTYLSNNNVIVYSPLKTPTYTEITDSTLINQLEAIKKSVEGQTNISQINNDMPFELDVTALSDGTVSLLNSFQSLNTQQLQPMVEPLQEPMIEPLEAQEEPIDEIQKETNEEPKEEEV